MPTQTTTGYVRLAGETPNDRLERIKNNTTPLAVDKKGQARRKSLKVLHEQVRRRSRPVGLTTSKEINRVKENIRSGMEAAAASLSQNRPSFVPGDIYHGDTNRDLRLEDYKAMRLAVLNAIKTSRPIAFITDGDGTCIEKGLTASSTASVPDAEADGSLVSIDNLHRRRVIAYGLALSGSRFILNTQRTGYFPAMNEIQSEDGHYVNELLSGFYQELGLPNLINHDGYPIIDAGMCLDKVQALGLAGALGIQQRDNDIFLELSQELKDFRKALGDLDSANIGLKRKSLLTSLRDIAQHRKIFEYKAIPELADVMGINEWHSLTSLVEHACNRNLKPNEFDQLVCNYARSTGKKYQGFKDIPALSSIYPNLRAVYEDLIFMLGLGVKTKNPSKANLKVFYNLLSAILKNSYLGALVIHFDPKHMDEKYKVFAEIAKRSRAISPTKDLFSIAGYDFSNLNHDEISNLNDETFKAAIASLEKGETPGISIKKLDENDKRPIFIIDNFQGYIEIAPYSLKSEPIERMKASETGSIKTLYIGSGDSELTDGPLLEATLDIRDGRAHGYGNIVGTKINKAKFIDRLVKTHAGHSDTDRLRQDLERRIIVHPNVKSANAFWAGIFSEIIKKAREIIEETLEVVEEKYLRNLSYEGKEAREAGVYGDFMDFRNTSMQVPFLPEANYHEPPREPDLSDISILKQGENPNLQNPAWGLDRARKQGRVFVRGSSDEFFANPELREKISNIVQSLKKRLSRV